ncbi:MAG TPA: prenyltransferase/squalene oxidase repeat-containing protein [Gemmataceae bacterium]|nr:prenyltransferase/squalene oxidase repeat-containing protein [Gemmataceae bacterium]
MKNFITRKSIWILLAAWALSIVQSVAQEPEPNSAKEPLAAKLSLAKGGAFLDKAALNWTTNKKCGSCHTNVTYMIGRPALKDVPGEAMSKVRGFFENRAANWDKEGKAKPRWDAEVVTTAVALAFNDAQTTGKLHDLTRGALDRMWKLQRKDGAWDWLKCAWPPMEHDDYFGAVFAALGAGSAPDDYSASPAAQAGLVKLRKYFKDNPPPDLHHQALLLWASCNLDGLMRPEQKKKTVDKLLALQRPDGGWSLPSLGSWKRRDGSTNDKNAPSDGYGTGLVIYVLRQAGLPRDDDRIRKGVAWLSANQRVSGRWFTRSLNNDRDHYITHTGTAYAVMALRICE